MKVKNAIQNKIVMKINVGGSAKIQENMCAKKVIFGIVLPHALKMVDMQKALLAIQRLCVIKL